MDLDQLTLNKMIACLAGHGLMSLWHDVGGLHGTAPEHPISHVIQALLSNAGTKDEEPPVLLALLQAELISIARQGQTIN